MRRLVTSRSSTLGWCPDLSTTGARGNVLKGLSCWALSDGATSARQRDVKRRA